MQTCGQGVSEGEEPGGPAGGKAASGHSFHLQGSAGPHADLRLATSVPSAWVLSPKTRQSSEQPPPGSPVSLPPAPCCPQERPLPAGRRTLGVQGREGVGQLQALIALCLSRPQGLGVGHEGHPLPAPGGPHPPPPVLRPHSRLPAQSRENKATDWQGGAQPAQPGTATGCSQGLGAGDSSSSS